MVLPSAFNYQQISIQNILECLTIIKTKNHNKKLDKKYVQTIHSKESQITNKHIKIFLDSQVIMEILIKTREKYQLFRLAEKKYTKKPQDTDDIKYPPIILRYRKFYA